MVQAHSAPRGGAGGATGAGADKGMREQPGPSQGLGPGEGAKGPAWFEAESGVSKGPGCVPGAMSK